MTGAMGLQIIVLVIMTIYIVRACMKLPKWLGIGFLVVFGTSLVTVVLMAIYYPEVLSKWGVV